MAKACHSDRVEDTVSYAKVIKTLRRVFTERTNDLLERTAEDLTAAVLAEYPEVLRVDLTLKKPQALFRQILTGWASPFPETGSNMYYVLSAGTNWATGWPI